MERHIQPDEMSGFTECFLTGSAAEVTPVSEIGPYKFTPGEISRALMNDYSLDVRREISLVKLNGK
jgi:branched-chain amino acid aminotransferase